MVKETPDAHLHHRRLNRDMRTTLTLTLTTLNSMKHDMDMFANPKLVAKSQALCSPRGVGCGAHGVTPARDEGRQARERTQRDRPARNCIIVITIG